MLIPNRCLALCIQYIEIVPCTSDSNIFLSIICGSGIGPYPPHFFAYVARIESLFYGIYGRSYSAWQHHQPPLLLGLFPLGEFRFQTFDFIVSMGTYFTDILHISFHLLVVMHQC